MASSPGIRDCDKVGIQNPPDCKCVLVETRCEYYSRPGQDKSESQNTNGLGLYRAPYTATSRQSQHGTGWAGEFYRNLKFDQTRENRGRREGGL